MRRIQVVEQHSCVLHIASLCTLPSFEFFTDREIKISQPLRLIGLAGRFPPTTVASDRA